MFEILKTNLIRIRKSKLFWAGCIGLFAVALLAIFYLYFDNKNMVDRAHSYFEDENYQEQLTMMRFNTLNSVCYYFSPIIICILAIVCPLIVGADNTYGTVRNVIVCGKSRTQIYFAKVLISILLGIFYCMVWFVTMFTLGASLVHMGDKTDLIVKKCGLGMLQIVIFACVYTMIIMIFKSSIISSVICIVSVFACICSYFFATTYFQRSAEKKYMQDRSRQQYEIEKKRYELEVDMINCIVNSGVLSKEQEENNKKEARYMKDEEEMYASYESYLKWRAYDSDEQGNLVGNEQQIFDNNYDLFKGMIKVNPIHYFSKVGLNPKGEVKLVYTLDGKEHEKKTDIDAYGYTRYEDTEDEDEIDSIFYRFDNAKDGSEDETKRISDKMKNDPNFKKLLNEKKELKKSQSSEDEIEKKVYNAKYLSASEMVLFDVLWSIIPLLIGYGIFLKKNIN